MCITVANESTHCSGEPLNTIEYDKIHVKCTLFRCFDIIICNNLLLLIDPTLTLPNLTTVLEMVNWYNVGWGIDIPEATLNMIRSSGDDSQRRRRCWEIYLNEHPAPSWKQVADALYRAGIHEEYLEELEVVQKEYLKGK